MDSYQFPRQRVLCDENPFSRELLNSLLEMVYSASPPFTGYLKFAGDEDSLDFLFFFNGAPYSAGRYIHGKPVRLSIRELGGHLAATAAESMSVTLCATDPVLLKNMLLFLREEPDIKAPTSLIDLEYVVQRIGEAASNAMIALYRDKKINFFFFKDGKGALAHYSDLAFKQPENMTVEEVLLLYAFQPGEKVQAFVFRDMPATDAEDASRLDKDSLYQLLTAGNPKNRATDIAALPGLSGGGVIRQKPKPPSFMLLVESGPLQGERFVVTLPCTIGRRDCDLILDDHCISRRHAEIKTVENELVIEDLGSTNGTRVNGEPVTRKSLVPNDLIAIGPINLRIQPAYGRRASDLQPPMQFSV